MVMRSDDGQLFLAYGTATQAHAPAAMSRHAHATLDIPASQVLRPNDLYDRVYAFASDVLGLRSLELRGLAGEGEAI